MLPIIPDFEVGPRQFNLVDDEVGVHNCVPPADATSCVISHVPSRTYQKPLLSQRTGNSMAKEEKKPSKDFEKVQKEAHDEHEAIIKEAQKETRVHQSRPDNVVKKE